MTPPDPWAALQNDRRGADVLFLAGEHSGDQHAAKVAADLRQRQPDWRIAAVGGPALQQAGADLLYDLTRDSVVGLVEVLRHYRHFKALFHALLDWIARHRPRLVVMVDYPGFNLRLAEALRKRGLSRKGGGPTAIYQYVSPQIWAWKAGRRFTMARCLDELGVIFPFEINCYTDTDLPVHFVGHPFVREDYPNPLRMDPEGPVLLLPGSRRQAVQRIFPAQLAALHELRRQGQSRPALCLYPDDAIHATLQDILGKQNQSPPNLTIRKVGPPVDAAAVLTSSGTMSLNCALAGIPGAIVYRAHPLTVWIGRRLVKVPYLGIANLVLNQPLYPEYVQEAARPESLAAEIQSALNDPQRQHRFAQAAQSLRLLLGANQNAPASDRLLQLVDP